jgi:hypothetical protein
MLRMNRQLTYNSQLVASASASVRLPRKPVPAPSSADQQPETFFMRQRAVAVTSFYLLGTRETGTFSCKQVV